MRARTIMFQGTSSDAGKSLMVAALCRILVDKGFKVAPFKSQNMALNSYPTEDGCEIGRAQVLQAIAARIKPSVDMNPILLKPTDSQRAQVIVRGKIYKNLSAGEYHIEKAGFLELVEDSLERLRRKYDIVVIEGAGSPAEINLKKEDIANMRIAKMADAPVILIGDIDRGGVFASLIGTLELLDHDERGRVKGIVINKFRGDASLLKPGIDFLEERTGIRVLGTIPYMHNLKVDSEDSLALDSANRASSNGQVVDIVVIRLPHIANFTDIDALSHEPGVNLRYVMPGEPIGDTDLVIIPGSKNTMGDMEVLHEKGMVAEIRAVRKKGVPMIGICGGYQMLGLYIEDKYGTESDRQVIEGMGLLNCATSILQSKVATQVKAEVIAGGDIFGSITGSSIAGYEIHMGNTERQEGAPGAFRIIKRGLAVEDVSDGCISDDGVVIGTYIHGLFDNGLLRKSLLDFLKDKKGLDKDSLGLDYDMYRQAQLDLLAETVSANLDVDFLLGLLGV
ncbi:MAG: cobyric acid synthase [Actinobacteria bacterium]|nr:cobyric acid synthase [Actinomycetota bacterium]